MFSKAVRERWRKFIKRGWREVQRKASKADSERETEKLVNQKDTDMKYNQ